MALERVFALSGLSIPDAHGVVTRSTREPSCVPGDGYGNDIISMALERVFALSGLGIPDAHGLVIRTTREPSCVPGDGYGFDI